MIEKSVVVNNPSGLHARPASLLVKAAGAFESDIHIVKDDKEIDAKSILGIMGLAVVQGTKVTVKADGRDEQAALAEIVSLLENLQD